MIQTFSPDTRNHYAPPSDRGGVGGAARRSEGLAASHSHGSERGATNRSRMSESGPPTGGRPPTGESGGRLNTPPVCRRCGQPKPPEAFPLLAGSGFPGNPPELAARVRRSPIRRWCVECLVEAGHLRRTFRDRWYDWLDQRQRVLAELDREDALTAKIIDQARADPVLRRALVRATDALA